MVEKVSMKNADVYLSWIFIRNPCPNPYNIEIEASAWTLNKRIVHFKLKFICSSSPSQTECRCHKCKHFFSCSIFYSNAFFISIDIIVCKKREGQEKDSFNGAIIYLFVLFIHMINSSRLN